MNELTKQELIQAIEASDGPMVVFAKVDNEVKGFLLGDPGRPKTMEICDIMMQFTKVFSEWFYGKQRSAEIVVNPDARTTMKITHTL